MIEFVFKKLASGKRIQELRLLDRLLTYAHPILLFAELQKDLKMDYGIQMSQNQKENIVNIMTNKFLAGSSKNTYADCVFIEKDDETGADISTTRRPRHFRYLSTMTSQRISAIRPNMRIISRAVVV